MAMLELQQLSWKLYLIKTVEVNVVYLTQQMFISVIFSIASEMRKSL